jgi:hypothetical protein
MYPCIDKIKKATVVLVIRKRDRAILKSETVANMLNAERSRLNACR